MPEELPLINKTDKINAPALPPSFRYRNVYEKGKPTHEKFDSFAVRHPPMELSKRAKIFSPFDALKGFAEAISAKEAEIPAGCEPSASADITDEDVGFMDDFS